MERKYVSLSVREWPYLFSSVCNKQGQRFEHMMDIVEAVYLLTVVNLQSSWKLSKWFHFHEETSLVCTHDLQTFISITPLSQNAPAFFHSFVTATQQYDEHVYEHDYGHIALGFFLLPRVCLAFVCASLFPRYLQHCETHPRSYSHNNRPELK